MNSLYQVAGVSKQAVNRYNNRRKNIDQRLEELIHQVDLIREVHSGCGVEKLYDTVKPDWLGRDKFISLFMGLGYRVRKVKNYKRTTYPTRMYCPNLIEGLLVWDKNRVWQTDLTYYQVGDRFFYLVFIIDIYTKVIRGYQVSDHMRAEANLAALQMALKGQGPVNGLIHHSDRGSQFIDLEYQALIEANG